MKESILFEDLTSLKNVIPIAIGAILCFVFGFLIISKEATLYYVIPAVIGIALLGIPQIKNIRRRNTIKYNNTGLTAKLLGHKTFGFQFQDIERYSFTDKALIIKIKKMDEITLSRKRYKKESLEKLHTLIQKK